MFNPTDCMYTWEEQVYWQKLYCITIFNWTSLQMTSTVK